MVVSSNASVISITKTRDQLSVSNEIGHWPRVFTHEGVDIFHSIKWKITDAELRNSKGEVVFSAKGVEVPEHWNQNTINVVVDKYFRIINGVREVSFKQVLLRVSSVIRKWAEEQNYFNSDVDAQIFEEELVYALLHQYGAFNSPVWFNLGVPGRKQAASACFISSVDDTLDDIMRFQKSEVDIFRSGSGSGANLSLLRSSYEKISSGSYTSGPISWMECNDKYAKAMKSGGSTRAAAKMIILDMDHPDILETRDGRPGFIKCKSDEEILAHKLVDIGYTSDYDNPNGAYKRVRFQNANHSVSISDAFMNSVLTDGTWSTRERKTSKIVNSYKARELWNEISKAAWVCGDPGVQFNDTMNKWNTSPKSGTIHASNPCSEFVFLDNTACNLCAINLTKFFDNNCEFLYNKFAQSVRLFSVSQMAIIDKAEYPTLSITENSKKLRPIGINYGDLGSLLMKLGFGYDSDEGRAVAARMSSLMTGLGYLNSAKIAARIGSFPDFNKNKDDMMRVMRMHQESDKDILSRCNLDEDPIGNDIVCKSAKIWEEVILLGEKFGYNVSQCSVQAPLGTISFLMGMTTTGIEPAFSLVSYKQLVGGGTMKMVNTSVNHALKNLKYSDDDVNSICDYIEKNGTIEGAPGLIPEHLPVFDCAMPSIPNGRYLTSMAHIKMMAAIQPLISGGISKTVNMPSTATVEDISNIYMESWKLGLKCIALYRDGCKASQPLSSKDTDTKEQKHEVIEQKKEIKHVAQRESLPVNVNGWRHRFTIDGYKGYIIVNEYPDHRPGEVFLKLGKPGSTISGLIDGFTQLLSLSLQYGMPLSKLITSFIDTRFEPAGMTFNPEIRFTKSLYDYLFKVLDVHYYNGEYSGLTEKLEKIRNKDKENEEISKEPESGSFRSEKPIKNDYVVRSLDAPPCSRCGSITQRSGSCHICPSCGTSSGCS